MDPLASRIASHVLTFAERWQLSARARFDAAHKLVAAGAAPAAEMDAALLRLDAATALVGVCKEIIGAGLAPGSGPAPSSGGSDDA